jgi:hypothetical protein
MEKIFKEWSKIIPQKVPDPANRLEDGTHEHLINQKLEQDIKDISIQKQQLVEKLKKHQKESLKVAGT